MLLIKKFAIIASLLLALLFAGCTDSTSSDAEVADLKVAYLTSDHDAPLFVAAEYPELFQEEYGVYLKEVEDKNTYELYENDKLVANVEFIKVIEGGAKIMTLMAQGQVDVGLNGVPPAVFSIDQGSNAKIVSPAQSEGSAIVIRSDIPAENWEEFVEYVKKQAESGVQVKIGHPLPTSIQYVMIKSALDTEGITYTENPNEKDAMVQLINCKGQGTMPQLLSSNELDAVIAWEPTPEQLAVSGIGKSVLYSGDIPPEGMWENHPCCVFVASNNAIENKRDGLKTFLKLMALSNNEITANQELAINASAEWLGTDLEVEELSIPNIGFTNEIGSLESIGPEFVKVMDEQGAMTGQLAGLENAEEINAILYDFTIYNEIMEEIQ
ncbi:ABC transporter substrate-binding protein [Methanococcus maripaludis]|uniref:NitT/TauT family transport system substrate-binding protein n=2 Tax=Methanococcus maripaludis TaxID=39152 RepID=A0A7J9PEY7_METMI|nr:ABC transporter substrate-binding protein [Methanococcus maripaludis]MBA2861227.1 NitT/TauT family transport system substrate-binding protein [Methanococcus maripaludis]